MENLVTNKNSQRAEKSDHQERMDTAAVSVRKRAAPSAFLD